MTKPDLIRLIALLSALESWCYSLGKSLPEHLMQDIDEATKKVTAEILK